MIDDYYCGVIDGKNDWQEKPKYLEKIDPNVALSTKNPT
jgi:hypothetical protein